jgi:hypothetical protein
MAKRANVYMESEEVWRALHDLAADLQIGGQRGPGQSPLLNEIGKCYLAQPERFAHGLREAIRKAQGGET